MSFKFYDSSKHTTYMRNTLLLATFLLFLAQSCQNMSAVNHDTANATDTLTAPVAKKNPHTFKEHDTTRSDDYFWLNDPKNPEVIAHLTAENDYTAKMLAHTEPLQKQLFKEITARLEEQTQSVPVKKNGFWYYTRYEVGKEYALICRKKQTLDAPEEILLDVPTLAKGYKVYRLLEYAVSKDNKMVAYLVDTSGDRRNTLFIKNLETQKILDDRVSDVSNESLVWANDNKTLFYILNDATVRGTKLMRHTLATNVKTDVFIYEEKDNTYDLGAGASRSHEYLLLASNNKNTSEVQFLNLNRPTEPLRMLQKRTKDCLYEVEHFNGDNFYILTNQNKAQNFKLVTAPIAKPSMSNWKEIVAHRDSVFLQGFEVLKNYLILQEKINGLTNVRVFSNNTDEHNIEFADPAYVAAISVGDEDNFEADSLRLNYTSMTTPPTVYNYNFKTRLKTILKQDKVKGYESTEYESKRIFITVRDSVRVPVSLVYKKDLFKQNGTAPMLLYAYGSYGANSEPNFSTSVVSLLDRGFVYAIAHIRGGADMGRAWYENGKLLKKKNTFTDYVDCAEALVKQKFTATDRLFGNGRSAGGMLMGAVTNMRPDLFRGILAEVPWMDVITDMYNDQLPLTTLEYDEWGNPNKKNFYDYMLSWSPYDQVKDANYPAIFATGGLNDTQVPYFSPAKWVARVREHNTGKQKVLLKVEMKTGHAGDSGRFERYKATALKYAFMLDLLERK